MLNVKFKNVLQKQLQCFFFFYLCEFFNFLFRQVLEVLRRFVQGTVTVYLRKVDVER